jgi:hypothetical protein
VRAPEAITTRGSDRRPKQRKARPRARRTDEQPTLRWPERRTTAVVLILFTAVFVGLSVGSYTQKSATWDEPVHVTDGYAALKLRDYRIDPEHPPFLRMWAALPLLAVDGIRFDPAPIDSTPPGDWAAHALFPFTHRFMYVDNDADKLLYRARFMIVLLGVVLGVLLFCWAREWLGTRAAIAALAFYTLEPNIAAHASLVTTDAGVACFMFGAVYFLWRTCRRASAGNIAGLTAFFTLAIVSKFSAILLWPIVVVLLGIASLRLRMLPVSKACAIVVLLTASAWIGIWAVYGFRYAPSSSATWLFRFQDLDPLRERVPRLTAIVAWVDSNRLLPNVFTQGFLIGQAKAQTRSAFLAGDFSNTGWWYFFPIAFLIKTPIVTILLLLKGLVASRPWQISRLGTATFAIVPIALYMASSMFSRLNIGLRHILPIYPFVLLLCAMAAKDLLDRRRSGAKIVVALTAIWALEVGWNYPDNLAFFNALVGGPRHGAEYLVDSSLDWGQDLKPLKRWMDRNGVGHVGLTYFGSADPAYYKIDCTYLPGSPFFVPPESIREPRLPGYVAASVTNLSGVYVDPRSRDFYEPLRSRTPVASIGKSINVYWVERPWWQ